MNELQVKTIEITPAVVEFNHEEIEKELEVSLKKYEGLVFSEDAATDLRNTIAELRKGKNAVDRYRIDTKKKLNEPVKQFEDKCKQLDAKFESVITPLVEQQNEFEKKRRAAKLEKLEKIRLEHIGNHALNEEYHERVVIDDSMLTKSASLKQSGESLEFQVKNLKMEQDKKAADKEIVLTTVKLANSENDLSFSADAYIRLLDYQDVTSVKDQINNDANAAVKQREQAEKERAEREKQAELERIEREEKESVEEEEKEPEQPVIEQEFDKVPLSNAPVSVSIDDIPFVDNPFMKDPFAEVKKEKEIILKITASDGFIQDLERFLKQNAIDFEVIDE